MDIKLLEMRRKALIESNGNFVLFNQIIPNCIASAGWWWDSTHFNCTFSSGIMQLKVKNNQESSSVYNDIISFWDFSPSIVAGHVYYFHVQYLSDQYPYFDFNAGLPRSLTIGAMTTLSSGWERRSAIRQINNSNWSYTFYMDANDVCDYSIGSSFIKIRNPCVIDLTEMFGVGKQPAYGSGSLTSVGNPQAFFNKCALNGIDLSTYQSNSVTRSISWRDA